MRTLNGCYLSAAGDLIANRSMAVHLSVPAGHRVLGVVTNSFSDPLRTLSMEWLPKRSKEPALDDAAAEVFIAQLRARYVHARIDDLRRQAAQHEQLAVHARREADRLEAQLLNADMQAG